MLCLSGFELYSRWVPLITMSETFIKIDSPQHLEFLREI